MDTFKQRIPPRKQLIALFLVCAFISNLWALYIITQEVPAWILRLSMGELVGVAAHTLLFALLDALFVFTGLVLLAILLPARWFRQRLVSIGAAVATLTAVLLIVVHTRGLLGFGNPTLLAISVGLYLLLLAGAYIAIQRSDKVSQAIVNVVNRLSLLAVIYLVLDGLGILIILVRTIGGVA